MYFYVTALSFMDKAPFDCHASPPALWSYSQYIDRARRDQPCRSGAQKFIQTAAVACELRQLAAAPDLETVFLNLTSEQEQPEEVLL